MKTADDIMRMRNNHTLRQAFERVRIVPDGQEFDASYRGSCGPMIEADAAKDTLEAMLRLIESLDDAESGYQIDVTCPICGHGFEA